MVQNREEGKVPATLEAYGYTLWRNIAVELLGLSGMKINVKVFNKKFFRGTVLGFWQRSLHITP